MANQACVRGGKTVLGDRDRALLEHAAAVVGVDEVGRGCLAGPVVVCAARFEVIPVSPWVRDSKKLGARRREETARWLREVCPDWVMVEVWPEVIDRINILEATRLAMRAAVRCVATGGDEVVVDYVELGEFDMPVHSIKQADANYFSVAAASILAKVHRDGIMIGLAGDDNSWGWSENMGYGTLAHRRAVDRIGRSYLHRQSFRVSPVLP